MSHRFENVSNKLKPKIGKFFQYNTWKQVFKNTHTHTKKKKTAKGTSYKIMESLTKFKEVKLQAARKEYGFRNV